MKRDNKKRLYKESKDTRKDRINSSRNTYTQVKPSRKGKGSYVRKKGGEEYNDRVR